MLLDTLLCLKSRVGVAFVDFLQGLINGANLTR